MASLCFLRDTLVATLLKAACDNCEATAGQEAICIVLFGNTLVQRGNPTRPVHIR
jgi:hypothetical protein